MSEPSEYSILKAQARSVDSVKIHFWGPWAGRSSRPRWACNKHISHAFQDTVDAVVERHERVGSGCPHCESLLETPTVDFQTFADDANAIIDAQAKAAKKTSRRFRANNYGLSRYAV